MKTFQVFKHDVKGYDAVKDGFSWPGFFFTGIWSLYRQLWWLFGIILLVVFVSNLTEQILINDGMFTAGRLVSSMINLSLGFIVGFKGNQFVVDRLIKQGYIHIRTVEANNKTEAINTVAKA